MAPLNTIPFPSTDDTQHAVSQWLDLIASAVQPGVRQQEVDRAARARILQQAAANMLAPIERAPRILVDLLR
jgi:hypothetical protein